MPEINASDYLDAVDAALANPAKVHEIRLYLTQVCPECRKSSRDMNEFDLGRHSTAGPEDLYVAIGCEGYFVINPNLLGLESPAWLDWTEDLDPNSDAARCTSCGHLPDDCECPHDCTPQGTAS